MFFRIAGPAAPKDYEVGRRATVRWGRVSVGPSSLQNIVTALYTISGRATR